MFFRSENSCTQQQNYWHQWVHSCCILLRLALDFYPFPLSSIWKQDCSFLVLPAHCFALPSWLCTATDITKSVTWRILCIAVPKSSWEELNRDAWQFWGKDSGVLFILCSCMESSKLRIQQGRQAAWLGDLNHYCDGSESLPPPSYQPLTFLISSYSSPTWGFINIRLQRTLRNP